MRESEDVRACRASIIVLFGLLTPFLLLRASGATQQTDKAVSSSDPHIPQTQKAVDVEGKWLITFVDRLGRVKPRTLTLHRDNETLTGTLDAPVCPCIVSGSIKGDKIKLRITESLASAKKMIWTANVTGDTMKGDSRLEGAPSSGSKFEGVRQNQTDPIPDPIKN